MCENALIHTLSLDPCYNLALEDTLFDTHKRGVTLYLWRNQNTVVIGRNQNAWKECRLSALSQDGGTLVRRMSGGGAVFHDTGNLNFTFITTKALYDQTRQLGVIIEAVRALGIPAGFTGRNDIVTADGAKFSGNAFRHSRTTDLHHGTLLIDVDMQKLSKYLAPSPEKLRSKGVDSVRARVRNLSELNPELTTAMMAQALREAFLREYGSFSVLEEKDIDQSLLAEATAKHQSWAWRCGASPAFDAELSTRFPWGGVELCLSLEKGRIVQARAYSDAMDEAFIRALSPALLGATYESVAIANAVRRLGNDMAADIANWLEGLAL
ncbi:MAG: lipoate--protein ligase [Eubacteriales bacterium]|nr:lipoate--protein ligase [Eubacteriales bacterium]